MLTNDPIKKVTKSQLNKYVIITQINDKWVKLAIEKAETIIWQLEFGEKSVFEWIEKIEIGHKKKYEYRYSLNAKVIVSTSKKVFWDAIDFSTTQKQTGSQRESKIRSF